jgi:hypothetical protein
MPPQNAPRQRAVNEFGDVIEDEYAPVVPPMRRLPQSPEDLERMQLAREAAARAREDQAIQRERLRLEREERNKPKPGRPLRQGDGDELETNVNTYSSLKNSFQSFNPNYAGNTISGDLENIGQSLFDTGTPGQRDWWANFRATDNLIRNGLYGASLTKGEQAAYDRTTISPRMNPDIIRQNIATRAEIVRKAVGRKINRFKAGQYNKDEIDAIAGEFLPDFQSAKPVIATGKTRDVKDEPRTRVLDALIRSKASLDVINKTMVDMGGTPVTEAQIKEARTYLRKNPGFKGSMADAVNTVPNNSFSTSPLGAALGSYVNMATGNNLDTVAALTGGDPSMVRAGLNSNAENQFVPSMIGGAAGAVTGMLPFTAGARAAGFAGPGAMLAAEGAYGAAAGGGGYENPDRVAGAGLGALSAMAGNFAGQGVGMGVAAAARSRPAIAGMNAVNRMRGRQEFVPPTASNRGERLVANAARGQDASVENLLQEASRLGLPMTPADAAAEFARLAGSAVRYSPDVQGNAQQMFARRNRGQIDRFNKGLERDLGPVANIPQTSADLMEQARTAADPLYTEMRATPGRTGEELEAILATDFGKQALAEARAIANASRKDVNKMGFDLDDQGEVILTSVPSPETLDYVKQGMDQVLEQYRDKTTGRMVLDGNPLARAQDGLRKAFIKEVDALNPAYAAARQAYAGPASARDALLRGKDSYNIQPDQLRMNVAQQSPADLAQMQLGYRGAMVDAAEGVRYTNNPYDATLGTPTQIERLQVMNQGNQNVDRLLRQAELERQMQARANDIMGGSPTQGRAVADQQFLDQNAMPSLAADAASMMVGGVPVATAARQIAGRGLKDFNMGLTRGRATQSANEMAPYLLNDDPAMAAQSIADLIARDDAYRQYVQGINNPLRRVGGLFGAAPVVTLGTSNR